MFYKYLLKEKHLNQIKKVPIESFSYTKLIDEPSLLHSHYNNELIIALNNDGYVVCNNKRVNLLANDILIVNANVNHTEKNIKPGISFEYYSIKINVNFLSENDSFKIISSQNNSQLIFYLKQAYANLTIDGDEYLAVINLSLFFLYFKKSSNNKFGNISSFQEKYAPYFINDSKNYILNNYSKNISVADLAEKYNISETLFCNKFKKYIHLTPKEFIIKTRIDYSMNLLLTTNYSVSQIANLCGFKSSAYFTKTFKQITKILPKHYRNSYN